MNANGSLAQSSSRGNLFYKQAAIQDIVLFFGIPLVCLTLLKIYVNTAVWKDPLISACFQTFKGYIQTVTTSLYISLLPTCWVAAAFRMHLSSNSWGWSLEYGCNRSMCRRSYSMSDRSRTTGVVAYYGSSSSFTISMMMDDGKIKSDAVFSSFMRLVLLNGRLTYLLRPMANSSMT